MQFTVLLPALIGIGLGRNPSGFLNDVFAAYGPMVRSVRRVFLAGVGIELVAWFLALRHTIDNWVFAIATGVVVVLLPRRGLGRSAGVRTHSTLRRRVRRSPLELIGIDRAFTVDDLRAIDRGAGFEGLSV